MNARLAGWSAAMLPGDWTACRDQWELGQGIHAAFFGITFCLLMAAILTDTAVVPDNRAKLPGGRRVGEPGMASFVVKAAPRPVGAALLQFDEKTMWRGKHVRAGDVVFMFAAEHNGGGGLYARGVVTEAIRGEGIRVSITVQRTGPGTRPLGRGELRPFRDVPGAGPEAEIDHKLYRQATNKIAGISDAAAAFLRGFF